MSEYQPNRLRLVNGIAVLCIVSILAAILIPAILAAREAARRSSCDNNLKQLALGVLNYSDTFRRLPMGTSGSRELLPQERFSWYLPLWPFFEGKPPTLLVDQNQAWDAPVNRSPRLRFFVDFESARTEDRPLMFLNLFSCPSASPKLKVQDIQVTQYVGMAGLGVESPEFDTHQAHIGVWGYDRQITERDITDGCSSTVLLAESGFDPGPWIAGGRRTVRGLDLRAAPYFGPGRQFGGIHSVCSTVMVDASVRHWVGDSDSSVFRALVTIADED
jgi:hypothetical protein